MYACVFTLVMWITCGYKLDSCMIGDSDRERWNEWVGVGVSEVGVWVCLTCPLIRGHGLLVDIDASR